MSGSCGYLLKSVRTLAADFKIVFAPISVAKRTRAILLAIIVTLLELAGFVLIAVAITSIEGNIPPVLSKLIGGGATPVAITAAAFSLFILRGLVTGVYQWWVLGVINEGERASTVNYVSAYLLLPFEQQRRTGSGDVLRTVRVSIGRSYQVFAVGAVELIAELPAMTALLVVLFLIAPEAALAVFLVLGAALIIFQRFAGHELVDLGRENERINTLDFQLLLQILNGARELLVRQVAGVFVSRLSDNRERLVHVQRRMTFTKASARLYLETLLVVGLGVVLLVVGLTSSGSIALSVVGVFAAAGFRALPSAARILLGLSGVQAGRAPLEEAAAQLRRVESDHLGLEMKPKVKRATSTAPNPPHIQLEDVWFRYSSQRNPVLCGASLDIRPGMSMALVGRSGAGKTTLVDIMLGLLVPSRGTVLIDGVPLETDSLGEWRSRLALVPQDVFVLDASIADNVRFGYTEDDRQPTVEDCLRQAQLWPDVEALPFGADTQIGANGTTFSGGQRQRLGIARALYATPEAIFLDEATSALDTVTEMALAQAVESLHETLTTVTVAHRLSTVRRCDQTAFVEAGRVVDVGTFDELRLRCEPFQQMVAAAESHEGLLEDEFSHLDPGRSQDL